MLEIKTEGEKTTISITNPSKDEAEIIERAKAVNAGIPYNPHKQSKEEIKAMFSKFKCNQKENEQGSNTETPAEKSAVPNVQAPDIPEKYFAPAEPLADDDYPL